MLTPRGYSTAIARLLLGKEAPRQRHYCQAERAAEAFGAAAVADSRHAAFRFRWLYAMLSAIYAGAARALCAAYAVHMLLLLYAGARAAPLPPRACLQRRRFERRETVVRAAAHRRADIRALMSGGVIRLPPLRARTPAPPCAACALLSLPRYDERRWRRYAAIDVERR